MTKRVCPGCRSIQELNVARCLKCQTQLLEETKAPVPFRSLCVRIAVACSVAAGLVALGARLFSVL